MGGRPRTFTTREKRLVVKLISSSESKNAVAAARKCRKAWKKDVSADTLGFRSVNRKTKHDLNYDMDKYALSLL